MFLEMVQTEKVLKNGEMTRQKYGKDEAMKSTESEENNGSELG